MDEVRSLPPRPTLKLDDESTAPVTHTGANPRRRRPYPQGNAPEIRDFASDGPPGRQRTVLRKRPPAPKTRQEVEEARRHSIELTDAERAYVWERMMGRAWRRRAYIGGNFALWTLWLITFCKWAPSQARGGGRS